MSPDVSMRVVSGEVDFLNDGSFARVSNKNYITNRTNAYYVDDTCSMDLLDFRDCGSTNTTFWSLDVALYIRKLE